MRVADLRKGYIPVGGRACACQIVLATS